MPIEVNGKSFETDEEGYLANLGEWEKDLATAMAAEFLIERLRFTKTNDEFFDSMKQKK